MRDRGDNPSLPKDRSWDGTSDEEQSLIKKRRVHKLARWTLPSLLLVTVLGAWQAYCSIAEVPHYVLPSPLLIAKTLFTDWQVLWPAMLTTGRLTLIALLLAVTGGVVLAIAFTQSKWVELSLWPYAIILQVTPVVAIAPLLQIYMDSAFSAALLCAWLVAFFPILSNTTVGLSLIHI